MLRTQWIPRILLTASLCVLVSAGAQAQGKGKGGGDDKNKGKDRGRSGDVRGGDRDGGKSVKPAKEIRQDARSEQKDLKKDARSEQKIERKLEHEVAGDVAKGGAFVDGKDARKFRRQVIVTELRPSLRRFFVTDRRSERVAAGAIARAHLRGLDDDVFVITPTSDRVRILNRSGLVLVDLDDDGARKLGRWDVYSLDDVVTEGAPSFCRSGEGHPVFGREWCLNKEFGLGSYRDVRWARTTRLDNVIFLQPANTSNDLAREALISLLGPVAYDRLALHAITLGLVDPLVGRWMGEPTGSRILRLSSGLLPVAEIVDRNRDDRADVMVVALRDW